MGLGESEAAETHLHFAEGFPQHALQSLELVIERHGVAVETAQAGQALSDRAHLVQNRGLSLAGAVQTAAREDDLTDQVEEVIDFFEFDAEGALAAGG